MTDDLVPISSAWIEARIHEVRGQRVMLDSDLARIYRVTNKRLVEQVRLNLARFPREFAWILTDDEARSFPQVRAFVRLRSLAAEYRELGRRIDRLESGYDIRFKAVFDAIRQLLEVPRHRRGRIGFAADPVPGQDRPQPQPPTASSTNSRSIASGRVSPPRVAFLAAHASSRCRRTTRPRSSTRS